MPKQTAIVDRQPNNPWSCGTEAQLGLDQKRAKWPTTIFVEVAEKMGDTPSCAGKVWSPHGGLDNGGHPGLSEYGEQSITAKKLNP